jgi:tetratricopeptide (TPR) repeat protein
VGDVPGFEIPARYFHFLRSGAADSVAGVLEHNRLDLISLAAVTARALELAQDGAEACRDEREQLGLGRLYERNSEINRAVDAYRLAASGGEREVRAVALSRMAELLRREGRHDEAAAAWQQVLEQAARGRRVMTRLEQRAAEGLAIHLEHRRKDPAEAKRFAELLRRDADGRRLTDAEHRLNRLDRKVQTGRDTKGGPSAAPLSFD